MHLYLKTDDLFWASAFAGAILSSTPKVKLTLEPTTDAIRTLSEYLHPSSGNMSEITIPQTDEEYEELDLFFGKQQKLEIEEFHNIRSDDLRIVPLPIPSLASTILLRDFNVISKPAFYYPKLKPNRFETCDGIITNSKFRPILENFLFGYGLTNPNILDVSEMDVLDQIKASFNPGLKIVAVEPGDLITLSLRSRYINYDRMSESIPALVVFDPNKPYDPRRFVSWAGIVPMVSTESDKEIQNKGRIWSVREKCNHDHHKFSRMVAANGKSQM